MGQKETKIPSMANWQWVSSARVLHLCDVAPFGCCFYHHRCVVQQCWPHSSQKEQSARAQIKMMMIGCACIHEPNLTNQIWHLSILSKYGAWTNLQDKVTNSFREPRIRSKHESELDVIVQLDVVLKNRHLLFHGYERDYEQVSFNCTCIAPRDRCHRLQSVRWSYWPSSLWCDRFGRDGRCTMPQRSAWI